MLVINQSLWWVEKHIHLNTFTDSILYWTKSVESKKLQNQDDIKWLQITLKNYFSSNNITKLKIVCLPHIFMRNVIVHFEVILFGSLTGWTMYFHIHSLPIFELKCEKILVCIKKNIFILWKVFKQFLFTSCNASKNLFVHCAHMFFFMYCNLWIEIIHVHFPWNNLHIKYIRNN